MQTIFTSLIMTIKSIELLPITYYSSNSPLIVPNLTNVIANACNEYFLHHQSSLTRLIGNQSDFSVEQQFHVQFLVGFFGLFLFIGFFYSLSPSLIFSLSLSLCFSICSCFHMRLELIACSLRNRFNLSPRVDYMPHIRIHINEAPSARRGSVEDRSGASWLVAWLGSAWLD